MLQKLVLQRDALFIAMLCACWVSTAARWLRYSYVTQSGLLQLSVLLLGLPPPSYSRAESRSMDQGFVTSVIPDLRGMASKNYSNRGK